MPECGRVRNVKRNRSSTLLERPQRLRTTQRTWEPSAEQAHSHSRDDPSTNEGAWGRIYYERKRAEGKTHNSAMRALKRRLATIICYRLKDGYTALGATDSLNAA